MSMWDRLRGGQKDDGAPTPSRQKLEAWQNAHSSSNLERSKGNARGGIQGGNSYYSYAVSGGPAPKRPPREYKDSNKLAPPVQQAQTAGSRNPYRDSDYGRPASSVYSQPSPVAATYAAQQLRNDIVYTDPNEISPPSSPELNPRNRPHIQDAGDVSPIDETPDMSQLTSTTTATATATSHSEASKQEPRTNIPMLRRERRKNSDAAAHALHQQKSSDRLNKQPRPYGHDVRWDPNTGEPTTSEKGRPSQIDPREFVQGIGSRGTSISPRHVKQAQQSLSAIGDRVRRMRGPSKSPQPEPVPVPAPAPARPEWRGASGRAPLSPPLQDSLNVAPLKVPPKSDRRAEPPSRGTLATTTTASANAAGSRSVSSPLGGTTAASNTTRTTNKTSAAGQQPKSPASAKTEEYPNSPVSNDLFAAAAKQPAPLTPRSPQSISQSQAPEHPAQSSLQVPSNEKATKRKSIGGTAIGHKPHPSGSSSVYSQPDLQALLSPPAVAADDWAQPPSRFSVTTYGTSNQSEYYRESFDVEAPPLPPPPPISSSPIRPSSAASSNSVMERGRPIVPGYEKSPRLGPPEPVKISLGSSYMTEAERKQRSAAAAAAAAAPTRDKGYGSLSIRPVSRSGAGAPGEKDLPLAPPETASVSAGDRVAQLNARLQALGNRRINLNTAIRQMTELMPTDSVLASEAVARKRAAERRKVEALRQELADVERESYDVGLSLHRAYKRLDRNAEYEPTTLWVRRVTG